MYSDPEAQVTLNVTQLVMSEALEWLIILNITMWSVWFISCSGSIDELRNSNEAELVLKEV